MHSTAMLSRGCSHEHHDLGLLDLPLHPHALCSQPQQTRRLYRQFEAFVLVCVDSLRRAHYDIWKRDTIAGPLARLNAEMTDDPPSTDEIELHPPYGADDPHSAT
jgi:hypothetical protein